MFINILKKIGHDLASVGKMIEEALPEAASVLSAIDPPVGLILTGVQNIVTDLTSAGHVPSQADLQALIKAVSVLESAKAVVRVPAVCDNRKSVPVA